MDFQWDEEKARGNLRKHGVDFADAATIFEDEMALTIEDPDAVGEHRFVSVGRNARGQILTVIYTLRGESIRIISARQATRHERNSYEEET
jgi:uncharacterized DUF497 family protein